MAKKVTLKAYEVNIVIVCEIHLYVLTLKVLRSNMRNVKNL